MHLAIAALATLILTCPIASAQQPSAPPSFDASTSLVSRIGGEIPARVNDMYKSGGRPLLKTYTPTPDEMKKAEAALALLTPLQKSIAQKHLRSFTFTDASDFNGQTLRSGQGDDFAIDIIFNRRILSETVSDFLTRKERQLFDASGSTLELAVDGGKLDAIVYVMLHETTHLVDQRLRLTPQGLPSMEIAEKDQTDFSRGIWKTGGQLAAPYEDPIFRRASFEPDTKKIPISEAKSLYEALGRTPAVSIYATRLVIEDLPETVAWRQMDKLGQPYRIEVRDKAKAGKVTYTYEPLKNVALRARFAQLSLFDSPAAN
jgi:hypothetical protein